MRSFIITQRVISSISVKTNEITLLKIPKLFFQFFEFSNILNFCLSLILLKQDVDIDILFRKSDVFRKLYVSQWKGTLIVSEI